MDALPIIKAYRDEDPYFPSNGLNKVLMEEARTNWSIFDLRRAEAEKARAEAALTAFHVRNQADPDLLGGDMQARSDARAEANDLAVRLQRLEAHIEHILPHVTLITELGGLVLRSVGVLQPA